MAAMFAGLSTKVLSSPWGASYGPSDQVCRQTDEPYEPIRMRCVFVSRSLDAYVPQCAGDPRRWELEVGSFPVWASAIAACKRCPILAACRAALEGEPEPPSAVIWAGIAFGERRQILSTRGLQRRSERLRDRARSTSSQEAAA